MNKAEDIHGFPLQHKIFYKLSYNPTKVSGFQNHQQQPTIGPSQLRWSQLPARQEQQGF